MVACFGIFTLPPTLIIIPSRITTVPFSIVLPGAEWTIALVSAHARGGFLCSSFAGATCAERLQIAHSKRIIIFFINLLRNWVHVNV